MAAIAAAMPLSFSAEQSPSARPNIVLIMVDDMGFSDIGCYGGEVRTRNLDRLASQGLRFTQAYNTARCCPTRASLLTGLYAHQTGVGHMMGDTGLDGYRGDLNKNCVTIAEALKPAGYGTYMAGKWHVTRFTKPDGPQHNWPRQRGFDRYFGTLTGAGSFWKPKTLTRDSTPIEAPDEDFFYTDAINDHAAKFVREHHRAKPNAPFFMYVAHTAPHWPLHAPEEDIARYRGKYLKGWDAIRAERRARMIEMGIVKKDWPMTPRDPSAKAWQELSDEQKTLMDHKMAVYAAQIDRVDQGLGRIAAALKETGRFENTLILFLADNGGCAEGGPWGFERKKGGVLGQDSSFASYGLSWANASNTPFRRYKHWVHEGGISTPLIAHWPARIKTRGQLRHQPCHVIDIMSTCLHVARAKYPSTHDGNAIIPTEGRSLVPAFAGEPIERDAIFWEHEGNRAVRRGKWKLVSKHPGKWELYDLEADRTELNDLADENPAKLKELSELYDAWAKRANVVPWKELPRRKRRRKGGSKKRVFDLKQGDTLAKAKAPMVKGRAISITVALTVAKPDGVILAQGGTRCGYALYVKDGRITLATRRNNKLTLVSAPKPLPQGPTAIKAHLAKDGAITLHIAGSEVARGKAPGPLHDMPDESLHVGTDLDGAVGEYRTPHPFHGKVEGVRIELGR